MLCWVDVTRALGVLGWNLQQEEKAVVRKLEVPAVIEKTLHGLATAHPSSFLLPSLPGSSHPSFRFPRSSPRQAYAFAPSPRLRVLPRVSPWPLPLHHCSLRLMRRLLGPFDSGGSPLVSLSPTRLISS